LVVLFFLHKNPRARPQHFTKLVDVGIQHVPDIIPIISEI
jgi:hypothetical protein